MAQSIDNATRAAIENLAQQKVSGAEIHRRLKAGKAGVPAQDKLTLRRVQQICQEARRKEPDAGPLPDDADAHTELHLKAALRTATQQMRRITGKQRKTASDAAELLAWSKTASGIRRELGQIAARSKNPQQGEAGSMGEVKTTLQLLEDAASAEQPASEPALSPSNGTETGNGSDTRHDDSKPNSQEDFTLSASTTPTIDA